MWHNKVGTGIKASAVRSKQLGKGTVNFDMYVNIAPLRGSEDVKLHVVIFNGIQSDWQPSRKCKTETSVAH
jgi:hypothetical protein